MSHSRPRVSGRPWPVQAVLQLFRACASLQLAVALITLCSGVLAWATFVEGRYGTPAVHFAIYDTPWFTLLNLLLALNVLCAATIRFPWKRHQTGFVVTHAGILVLLAGCWLSQVRGIKAQLSIFEGKAGHIAYKATQHFQLKITPLQRSGTDAEREAEPEEVEIPLVSGPFHWDQYEEMFWFPWRLPYRSRGVIYNQDRVTLEVLDYYHDSRRQAVPMITLRTAGPSMAVPGQSAAGRRESEITLAATEGRGLHPSLGRFVTGQQAATPQGHRVAFWMTGSEAQTKAFLDSRPQGNLGPLGQVVLHAGGKKFAFSVEQLRRQRRQPLGETGLEVELVQFDPEALGVVLQIHHDSDPPRPMWLYASRPHENFHDGGQGVFGVYWFDVAAQRDQSHGEPIDQRALHDAGRPRIDVVQGHDGKLYYRTWHSPRIGPIAPWPDSAAEGSAAGGRIVAFAESDQQLTLSLADFIARDEPGWQVHPLPFVKKASGQEQPRAKLRLIVDGQPEEFWLCGPSRPTQPDEQHVVQTADRRVEIAMPPDEIELGFQLYLRQFERKLDPGSTMASHYASRVDLLERQDDEKSTKQKPKRLKENILITLNAPVDFSDPKTGRSYRMFQSSFDGPWEPGSPEFDALVDPESPRDQLFLSRLTVNYDPGRGLKYAGSLLLIVGIGIMFYMRAYFFGKRGK